MWVQRSNNYLCNYLDQIRVQKKHIERVLSAKEKINDNKPYYPKFLQLRLGKNQFEEEKNIIIREENKNLFYKIVNAKNKPSKYSKIFEPSECPSFNLKKIGLKREKKKLENYNENVRFYHHLENVKSFYDLNDINKRNSTIDINKKKLQKSILEIQPSLFFESPQNAKKSIKKIKYISFNKSKTKRCNSCCNRDESKNIFNKIKKQTETNRLKPKYFDKNDEISKIFNSDRIVKINNKIKKIMFIPTKIKIPKKYKDYKTCKNSNKILNIEKNINDNKKYNSSYDYNSKNIKEIKKVKMGKHELKRNSSEYNIFK